jgi:molybdate/tungstate transport system substrate-binding protein
MKTVFHLPELIIVLITILTASCSKDSSQNGNNSTKTPLVVFAAGSLIIPFQHLETAFEAKYPGIDVQAQYHGSIQVMRHATELHEPIDVVATADASLIPMLMYATNDPETGLPYGSWYILFATNRLAVAYEPDSLYSDMINSENWYEVLSRPDVKVGIPDPRFDAAGYRALMAFALARDYYQKPTIFMDMFRDDFTYSLGIFEEDDLTTVTVPEIVETSLESNIVIRGGSIALIALLESGDIDYSFEYESVIRQHGLEMVQLPDALNLGSQDYIDTYRKVQVILDFQRFASVKPEFRGERIGYGITIPSSAPHPEEAALFIEFLLSPDGRAIMQADSHPVFDPAVGENFQNIPAPLQAICVSPEVP